MLLLLLVRVVFGELFLNAGKAALESGSSSELEGVPPPRMSGRAGREGGVGCEGLSG